MCKCDGPCGCIGEQRDIVPFDALTFFQGGWELVPCQGGDYLQYDFTIKQDGTLAYPRDWKGMRKKKVRKVRWLNLYFNGEVSVHSSKESADGFRVRGRRFECRKIEWEV